MRIRLAQEASVSPTNPDRGAWVLAATTALNHFGSWTGRVHIHKHLFITKVVERADPPFEFVLYDYGPYSFDLDQAVTELELLGFMEHSYPKPGYGPRYAPTLQGYEAAASLQENELRAVKDVARQLGTRTSQELELIATCLWMERKKGVSGDEEVVRQVRQAKPKYDESTIRQRLQDAHSLVGSLAVGA
jgi:uncharacterized protein YwgA